jgi:hypothetical protein
MKKPHLEPALSPSVVAQGYSERDVQLEPASSAKRWLELARQTWTSAAVAAVVY